MKNLNYYQVKIKKKIKNEINLINNFNAVGLSFIAGFLLSVTVAFITRNPWSLTLIVLSLVVSIFIGFYKEKREKKLTINFQTEKSIEILHKFNVESFGKIRDKYYRDVKHINTYESIKDIENYENTIFKNNHKTSKNYEKYVVFCFVHLMPLIKNTDVIVNNYEQKQIIDFIESAHKSITSYVKKESNKDLELLQFDKLWYDSYNKKVEERELMDKEKENDFSNLLK